MKGACRKGSPHVIIDGPQGSPSDPLAELDVVLLTTRARLPERALTADAHHTPAIALDVTCKGTPWRSRSAWTSSISPSILSGASSSAQR